MSIPIRTFPYALLATVLAIAPALGLLAVAPPAEAQNEGMAGDVSADLVTVHETALLDQLEVAEAEIARARGEVGENIPGGQEVPEGGPIQSWALANNLEATLLGELELEELLVHAEQASPPDVGEADEDTLIDLPADPILNARVAHVRAQALTGDGSGCPPDGGSLVDAYSELTDAAVLTEGGGGGDLPLEGLEAPDDGGGGGEDPLGGGGEDPLDGGGDDPLDGGGGELLDEGSGADDLQLDEGSGDVQLDEGDSGGGLLDDSGLGELSGAQVTPASYDGTQLAQVEDERAGLLELTGRDESGVVASHGVIDLVDDERLEGQAVRSTATTDLAAVQLGGEFELAIVSQPHLSVTSAGPNTTEDDVEWEAPIVEIRDAEGNVTEVLDTPGEEIEIPGVATISLGTVDVNVEGNTISAEGEVLRIDIADDLGALAHTNIAIAPLEASATTPEGGVICDGDVIGIDKDISNDPVAPGETFTYFITIRNEDPACTLTDVTVTDAIDAPAGTEVVDTRPQADSIDGLTVVWDDVGPIEPGEEVGLEVDVKVAEDATEGTIRENVSVDALCDDQPVDGERDFEGPRIAVPDKVGEVPRRVETGGGVPSSGGQGLTTLALFGALASAGAIGLRRTWPTT